jgi:photosynthetic reaction center cytochrome c subunit
MKFWSSRLTLAIAAMAVFGLSASALFGQAGTPAKGKTAGEVFKNVTTSPLKGLTVDDFMGSMGVMAAALGFDCADCHTGAGTDKVVWEDDTNRKKMARRMTEMVAVINKTNFGGVPLVSCWTCHHGKDIPATTIALDNLYGPPNEEKDDIIAKDDTQPAATVILDKYIAALGGAQKLSTLKSFIATGTQGGYVQVKGGGQFQIFAQAPDKRTVRVTYKDAPDRGNQSRAFNGTIGWTTTPRALLGEYEVTGTELDGLHFDAELAFPGQIKEVLTDLRVGYPDTIDGKDVQVVQGHGPRGLLVTLYFDKQTGLLVREIRFGRTPIGRVPSQVDYSDYRAVDGIKFPFQYKFQWLDGRDTYQITDVKINVPIEESRFGKPSMGSAQ